MLNKLTRERILRRFTRGAVGFIAGLLIFFSGTPAFAQGACVAVARIVSAQGFVFVSAPAVPGAPPAAMPLQPIPVSAGTQVDVCAGQTVQSGPRSTAAVLLLLSNQTIKLDQNTTLTILAEMPTGQRSVIDLVQGLIRLFNPIGRGLDVRTPFVTAGTEGTEFFVAYDPQTQDTTTGVIEGFVRASTNTESIRLAPGEIVRARANGPFQRLNIVPTDAVRWTIYYPPAIWNLPAAEEAALDPDVRAAWQAWRNGDLSTFAMALNRIPRQPPDDPQRTPLNAQSLLRFAALLLVVGQVDEASAAIDRAETLSSRASLIPLLRSVAAVIGIQFDQAAPAGCRASNSALPLAQALRAVICVAQNQTDLALTLSDQAVSGARQSGDQTAIVGAAIARSYALQSAFRLPEARAILLSVASSNDPLVLARLAEIDLSLGNNLSARREAQRASELAPSLGLTSSILGFSALANYEFSASRAAFERAAASSPGDPLPHLGLGLLAIRSRNLEEGRREMVIAVALDPESSVARSYLGRTYAGLRLYPDAFREWSLAEASDPKDPTASLYRAFAERALNRPAEALRDIEKSIALNDNRAVYRSRLLLDQDLATRTTGLASVYRDLGFDQLALSEGYKSVSEDPANPGAHRFLSDSYLAQPRHETASDSELLQSLLLQPLNVQPLRPRLAREGLGVIELQGPFRVGYNEFSPLFASNGLSLLGDAFGGNRGTYGENLVASGIYNNVSFSAGQFFYRTDGFRDNNQIQRNIENVLVQVALSDRASVFAEFRHSAFDQGDVDFLFDPNDFNRYGRASQDSSQYRLGGRFEVAPGFTLVGVWTREHSTADLADPSVNFFVDTKTNGDFGETAIYFSRTQFNVVAGGGYLSSSRTDRYSYFFGAFALDSDTTHKNAWVYATVNPTDNLHVTLGASYDSFRSNNISAAVLDRDQFNPKIGLIWEIAPGSVLRAAYFEGLKRTVVGGQTIEPTQIAGFNQLFDDVNSTKTKRWGAGFDQKFGEQLFAGIEWSQRQLEVPGFDATVFPPVITDQDWGETLARSYIDWVITDRFSTNFGLQWERFVRDPTGSTIGYFANMDILRVPLEFRYFDPSGLLAFLRTSYVHQRGRFLQSSPQVLYSGQSSFAVVDAGVGWRFPGRAIIGTLQVKNLLNSGFKFQDSDAANPAFIPRRFLLGRITFSF